MDINLTLFGEMLTFGILVWVTMKYIWPPITNAMQDRQQKIAAGLEAAKQGQEALDAAKKNIEEQLHIAKNKADMILEQAIQKSNNLIEEGRIRAQKESKQILAQTKIDIAQEINKTKQELQDQTASLVIAATEQLLQQKMDIHAQQNLTNRLIDKLFTKSQ